MGFVAYMGAAEINAISFMEIQGKVWEDNKTLFLNTRGSKHYLVQEKAQQWNFVNMVMKFQIPWASIIFNSHESAISSWFTYPVWVFLTRGAYQV